jgi:hypothetical protein
MTNESPSFNNQQQLLLAVDGFSLGCLSSSTGAVVFCRLVRSGRGQHYAGLQLLHLPPSEKRLSSSVCYQEDEHMSTSNT